MAFIGSIENFLLGNDFTHDVSLQRRNRREKAPLFLTFIGSETFEILCKLLYPKDVTKQKYSELKAVLIKHFKPSSIEIAVIH